MTPPRILVVADDADQAREVALRLREVGLPAEISIGSDPGPESSAGGGTEQAVAAAVRATEDRFFETSIDMLCYLGFDGYFVRLNPAWERTLGFSVEELMLRPFIEFVHPDDRERTLAQNARVRDGGRALSFENRYLCRDGSYRWFHWNAASDARGTLIYSVARDVTESKRAREERDAYLARHTDTRFSHGICPSCLASEVEPGLAKLEEGSG